MPTVNSQSSKSTSSSELDLYVPALISNLLCRASSFNCFRSGTIGVVSSVVCVARHCRTSGHWTILGPWMAGRGRLTHRVEDRAPLDSINHEGWSVDREPDSVRSLIAEVPTAAEHLPSIYAHAHAHAPRQHLVQLMIYSRIRQYLSEACFLASIVQLRILATHVILLKIASILATGLNLSHAHHEREI